MRPRPTCGIPVAPVASARQSLLLIPRWQVIDDDDDGNASPSSWKTIDDLMGLPVKGALHGAASSGGHFEPSLRLMLGAATEH